MYNSYMEIIARTSPLWLYLPDEIKGLLQDGEDLLKHAQEHQDRISDFSYLVFPFSKAYEGFLKRLFLDLDLIKEDEYYSDDIRIGRILNPHFLKSQGNIFLKFCVVAGGGEIKGKKSKRKQVASINPNWNREEEGRALAERLWTLWKRGRNQVFHYFPHNFRKLSYDEAFEIVKDIVDAMNEAAVSCGV